MAIDRNATCEITADDYVNLSVFDLLSRAKNGDVLAQQVLSRTTRPANKMNKYDENQPRDDHGRFASDSTNENRLTNEIATQKQRDAIVNYKSNHHLAINEELRSSDYYRGGTERWLSSSTGKLEQMLDETIPELTSIISEEPPLAEPMVLYRGFSNQYGSDFADSLTVGQVFTDYGFCSTATDSATAERGGNNLFIITAPAGTSALDMNHYFESARFGQNEILLQRGTSFEVKDIRNTNGDLTIRVEIVGQAK